MAARLLDIDELNAGAHYVLALSHEGSGERAAAISHDHFAIYLDSDLATARRFILGQAANELALMVEEPVDINPKGQLQELLQAISPRSPAYEVISQSGPEHQKTFVVRATWEGIELAEGTGRSKKQAETAAAVEAMKERRWEKTAGATTAANG